jgi:prepilin signal peptidase PulO-like enzyme (type II secretory pathway)
VELFLFVPAFLGFLYASYTDMKSKLVPDNLVYGLIGLGIAIRAGQAFLFGIESVEFALTAFLLYCAVGYVFYRFRGWADGDFGMFVAISLFLPSSTNSPWPAYISYISNLACVGVAYGFVYTAYLSFKPEIFKRWTSAMSAPAWFVSVALGLCGAFVTQALGISFVPGLVLGFFVYPLSVVSASLSEFMKRWVVPSELETGDWVLEDVLVGGKVVIRKDNPGLTRSEISLLEGLHSKGKLKKVLIKDGVPFIPVFFLAYLGSVFYGDLIYALVQYLIL